MKRIIYLVSLIGLLAGAGCAYDRHHYRGAAYDDTYYDRGYERYPYDPYGRGYDRYGRYYSYDWRWHDLENHQHWHNSAWRY